jgi:hypothetical protein
LPIEMLKPVQEAVIQPFTGLLATLSTAIILPFDDTVIAQGRILRDATTGFAVSIEAGCNGVEAAIVLISGVVAFPASVKHKIIAILAWLLFCASPEYRPHYLALLSGSVEPHGIRVVSPLPVAGAHYAGCVGGICHLPAVARQAAP